jgi:hypothetical protein
VRFAGALEPGPRRSALTIRCWARPGVATTRQRGDSNSSFGALFAEMTSSHAAQTRSRSADRAERTWSNRFAGQANAKGPPRLRRRSVGASVSIHIVVIHASLTTMIGRFAILLLIAGAACTHAPAYVSLRAPNPNGCYVIVHDRVSFGGTGDVFNGPGRWPRLERLLQTNEESWRNRIRSLRVGRAATLTVYAEEDFEDPLGNSRQRPSSRRFNRSSRGESSLSRFRVHRPMSARTLWVVSPSPLD